MAWVMLWVTWAMVPSQKCGGSEDLSFSMFLLLGVQGGSDREDAPSSGVWLPSGCRSHAGAPTGGGARQASELW